MNQRSLFQHFSPFRCAAIIALLSAATASWAASPAAADHVAACGQLSATIVGTDGPDRLVGTSGPDVIAAGDGDDVILARGGDDIVCAGDGNDTIVGGTGDDSLAGEGGDDKILGRAGADRLDGGPGADYLNGAAGDDVLSGDAGDDALFGRAGNDRLSGADGRDKMRGGSGDDVVVGGIGFDSTRGGPGQDTCEGSPGQNLATCEEEIRLTYHRVSISTTFNERDPREYFGPEYFANGRVIIYADAIPLLPVADTAVTTPDFSVMVPDVAGELFYRSEDEDLPDFLGGQAEFGNDEAGPIEVELGTYIY